MAMATHLAFIFLFQLLLQVSVSEPTQLKLDSKILQESIVDEINRDPNAGWKATLNTRFANHTVGQFKHILGVKPTPKYELESTPVIRHPAMKLPDQFDARSQWSQCTTIGRILDQGHCGSCWAFGAVESLSDRFCIHFGMNVSLSVNDLLACCGFLCGSGCNGGYPLYAWRYFKHHGVVTEECDPYFDNTGCSHPGCEPAYHTPKCHRKCVSNNLLWKESKHHGVVTEECDPYFDNTGCSHPGCEPEYHTPKCQRKCVSNNLLWKESKHYGVSAYKIHSDPSDIMAEVYKNGPVEVAFTVYEDFAHYKSGVYKHITGGVLGGHAVKLIGWGTSEEGEAYWLLANQWNRGWGDDGYFMIRRGTNECGIEKGVVAGMPSSKNLVGESVDADAAYISSV